MAFAMGNPKSQFLSSKVRWNDNTGPRPPLGPWEVSGPHGLSVPGWGHPGSKQGWPGAASNLSGAKTAIDFMVLTKNQPKGRAVGVL